MPVAAIGAPPARLAMWAPSARPTRCRRTGKTCVPLACGGDRRSIDGEYGLTASNKMTAGPSRMASRSTRSADAAPTGKCRSPLGHAAFLRKQRSCASRTSAAVGRRSLSSAVGSCPPTAPDSGCHLHPTWVLGLLFAQNTASSCSSDAEGGRRNWRGPCVGICCSLFALRAACSGTCPSARLLTPDCIYIFMLHFSEM